MILTRVILAFYAVLLLVVVASFVAFFPPLHRLHPTSQDVAGIQLGEPRDQALADRDCTAYVDMVGEDAVRCADPKGSLTVTFAQVEGRSVVDYVGLDAALASRDACDGALAARYGMNSRTRDFGMATLPAVGEARFLAKWSDVGSVCHISAHAIDLNLAEMDRVRAAQQDLGKGRL